MKAWLTGTLVTLAAATVPAAAQETPSAERAIADCARVASHPDDPDRIAPGLEREEIDLPSATAACRAAVAAAPRDARNAYHLGRLLYYAGDAAGAEPLLRRSADDGYRQAVFVLGYLRSLGERPRLCEAAALWQRAVALRHPWAAWHLVDKTLDGALVDCDAMPAPAELPGLMALARSVITVEASAGRVEALGERLALLRGGATDCDRLIAHPDDPDRVAPGVERAEADLPAAIVACQRALRSDPDNPRLNYQLARALGYSGRGAEALPYRARAVEGGYPQALFVVGYITLLGLNEQPQDACEGGRLILASARAGRLAGQVGFPHYWLEGRFAGCGLDVADAEMVGFLDSAERAVDGNFYKGVMVEHLRDALARHRGLGPE